MDLRPSPGWIMLMLAAFICSSASAATVTNKKYGPKVMVFDLTADPSFKPSTLRAIDDFFAGAIHDQGFRVLTHENILAAVGLDKQKKLLGCNDSSCLAEIGGALGADYIVRGNLAALDQGTAISLSLIDTKGQSLNEIHELAPTQAASELIKTVVGLAPRLMEPLRRFANPAPAAEANRPAATEAPATPPSEHAVAAGGLTASAQPQQAGPGAGTYALVGTGAAALVAGGVLGVLSLVANGSATSSAPVDGAAAQRDASRAVTEGRIAVPLLAVGAAVAITGIVLWARSSAPASEASR